MVLSLCEEVAVLLPVGIGVLFRLSSAGVEGAHWLEAKDLHYAGIVFPGLAVCKRIAGYCLNEGALKNRAEFFLRIAIDLLLLVLNAFVLGLYFHGKHLTFVNWAITIVLVVLGMVVFLRASSDYFKLVHP